MIIVEDPQSTSALLVCGAALVVAWLFARAERALSLRSQANLERLIDQVRPWGWRILRRAISKRQVMLAIGVGHLIAEIVIVAVAAMEAHRWTTRGVAPIVAWAIAGLASLVLLALVHFLVPSVKSGEELPEGTVRLFAPIVAVWTVLWWPVIWPFDRLQARFVRQPEAREAREEALIALVEDDSEEGIIEPDMREMISSIMNIDETAVREVMVPRIDIVAIERNRTLDELLALFVETQHSRIPVYDERIDHIIGVVHAKDVIPFLVSGGGDDLRGESVERFVREGSVLFVPESKKIDELLREFRRETKHMAIVVDEYGGTAGLVTLEDILEEIVGEIRDEYDDEEELPYRWLGDDVVEIGAGTDIADVNEILGSELPEENGYDTLGGFLYHQFSAIPEEGAATTYGPYRFVVMKVDAHRIEKVRVEIDRSGAPGVAEQREQAAGS